MTEVLVPSNVSEVHQLGIVRFEATFLSTFGTLETLEPLTTFISVPSTHMVCVTAWAHNISHPIG